MTQVTPPGWYPDPGQTSDGPRSERWWDGSRWTEQIRFAAAGAWGPPGYPGMPPVPPVRKRRGLRTAIGAGVVIVVLACIGGGVYAMTSHDNGKADASSHPSSGPSHRSDGQDGSPGGPGGVPGPSATPQPQVDHGYVTDPASGISLPVPDGWKGTAGAIGAEVTTGTYPCPGDTSQKCVRGGVFSQPAVAMNLKQTTAEAAAKADISKNATESYGDKVYGTITSHDELASQAVDVAGQKGYMVRWKVVTSKGDDGYVESLAFPSPSGEDFLVVVRFGFDVNAKAPKMATMDQITKGIKKAAISSASGGNGKQV